MLHLVCDCGALLSVSPAAGGRTVSCRSCGASRPVPDPAALGIEEAASLPSAGAGGPPPGEPAPVPPSPPSPHPRGGPAPVPAFGSDVRLDMRVLERHASRMGALSVLVWAAGLSGAAGTLVLSSRTTPERALIASGILFAALLAWSGFRAARAAALASIAVAQRQREILRAMGR